MALSLRTSIATAAASPKAAREGLIELSRLDCEESLAEFTRQAWHVIEPAAELRWNWHVDVVCAYLEAFFTGRITRLIISIPPGTLKSVLVSVMGPAWNWARDPGARMINITNELALATRDSLRMKHIVTSDWYQARWGKKVKLSGDQKEKMHFENTKRGFRQGLGISGSLTGKRGSFLLIDDALDAKKAFSDIQCKSVNDSYDQAVSSRLNNPATDGICVIQQRLRIDDLTGHLLSKKATNWVEVKIPMEYEGQPGFDPVRDLGPQYAHLADPRKEVGELLFPERFPPSVIASMKEDLGEYGYASQAQQRPSPLVGGIIKQAYWRIWPDDRPMPKILHCFASYDTAFSDKDLKESAYSAATIWGVWLDESDIQRNRDPRSREPAGRHKLILLSAWWERVDIDDLLKQAAKFEAEKLTHPDDAHLIEDMASGKSLVQMMLRRSKVRVLRYDPKNDGGGDKIFRANIAARSFRAGMVYAPNRPWAHQVIGLVGEFGPGAGALSKDITDTVTQGVNYLVNGWWVHHPDDDQQPAAAPEFPDDTDEEGDNPVDRLLNREKERDFGAW